MYLSHYLKSTVYEFETLVRAMLRSHHLGGGLDLVHDAAGAGMHRGGSALSGDRYGYLESLGARVLHLKKTGSKTCEEV